jgi:Peptidogalycan biosysnthesis/recognition
MWTPIVHDVAGALGALQGMDLYQIVALGSAFVVALVPALLRPSILDLAAFGRTAEESGASFRQDAGARGRVEICLRRDLADRGHWPRAFANERKDHRYYEVVEDTIHQGFDYRYFVLRDETGHVCAVQPFFVLDQDLLAGSDPRLRRPVSFIRRLWPRFMMMRSLMVGCAAGEGHIDGSDALVAADHAQILASAIRRHARDLRVKLIVLKEFPARYRAPLKCFLDQGFVRFPSLPMVRLNIDYPSFDAFMSKALSANMRRNLRKKFKSAAKARPIEMSLVDDVVPVVDDVHRLYLQVFARSQFQFKKLTKEFFCGLARRMPDKMRFFVWRQDGRIVAFAMCMAHEDTIYFEYLGLDYRIALDVHLYHNATCDLLRWAMVQGYKWCCSTAVNYDPKYHLRFMLDPLDLYVRHTSSLLNFALKLLHPLAAPIRSHPILRQFANYARSVGRCGRDHDAGDNRPWRCRCVV